MSKPIAVNGDELREARTVLGPAALAGALACAGLAVLVAAATVTVTFALSESYGFGPVWDLSAFVMTVAAAMITGGAAVAALRLLRRRRRSFPVLVLSVAAVLLADYAAGVIGNSLH
jgi:uncharacterized RDD family membrane protein YckC